MPKKKHKIIYTSDEVSEDEWCVSLIGCDVSDFWGETLAIAKNRAIYWYAEEHKIDESQVQLVKR